MDLFVRIESLGAAVDRLTIDVYYLRVVNYSSSYGISYDLTTN